MQVYRGFDAATAKPTVEERRRVPHHLVDVIDPGRDFTLAEYVALASEALRDVSQRGRVPVVVGGTGLYLRGLLRGIVAAPARVGPLRERLRSLARRYGTPRLHRWLARLDPGSASRLPPRDTQRIVRALEIALAGGATWSERLGAEGTWARGEDRHAALKVGLDLDRGELARRLEDRVALFFRQGLVEEVRALLERGVPPHANAFKAIGYREVLAAIAAREDPAAAMASVLVATRRYAKRQRTWFRKESGVIWLDAAIGAESLADRIVELWRETA